MKLISFVVPCYNSQEYMSKAYKSHILTKKSQKRKRNLRKSTVVDSTNVKSMKKALPYL